MATPNSTRVTSHSAFSWRRGVALADELLDEANEYSEACALPVAAGDDIDRPRYDILGSYLARVKALEDPTAERAFLAVLSDALAHAAVSGATRDESEIRQIARLEILTSIERPDKSSADAH